MWLEREAHCKERMDEDERDNVGNGRGNYPFEIPLIDAAGVAMHVSVNVIDSFCFAFR